MISNTKLIQECYNERIKLEEKYERILNSFLKASKEQIDFKCERFSLTHSELETNLLRVRLELKATNKFKKLQAKYEKKAAKRQVYEEFSVSKAEDEISELELKSELKLKTLRLTQTNEINAAVEEFSKTHDAQENALFRIRLELKAKNKYEKLESKLSKRIGSETIYYQKKNKTILSSSKRIWELDVLRGIAIWGMVIDHFIWNFTDNAFFSANGILDGASKGWITGFQMFADGYWTNDFRVFVRLFGVFLFVLLCGVSTRFSKNNLKRGAGIFGFGLAITIVMSFIANITKDPSMHILISTMTSIGVCLLIYTGICELCKLMFGSKNWKWICLGFFVVFTVFWAILCSVSYLNGETGHTVDRLFERFFFIFNNYGNDIGWITSGFDNLTFGNWWQVILGLKGFGSDWLGIFPYLGFIFLGGFVGETVYADRKSIIKYFYHKENTHLSGDEYYLSPQGQMNAKLNMSLSGISYPGRHTLFVYVFHQPIIFSIMLPIFYLSGYTLNLF